MSEPDQIAMLDVPIGVAFASPADSSKSAVRPTTWRIL